jgi:DNA-directed RNA polymerase specialized sigma24 family protein
MISASPQLRSTTEECPKHLDIPIAGRRREPDGESGKNKEGKENKVDGQNEQNTFDLQFSRACELLHFIARRILNCVEEAEEAVRNCRLKASRNTPGFSSEGAFKSWLVRILIDEATLLLRGKENNATASSNHLWEQVQEHLSEER